MIPSLTLNLFGGVNLWHDGVMLAAPKSRKGLALFLYLACTGRAHTREALADLLWDTTSTSQSLSNLRTVLSRLPAPLAAHLLIDRAMVAVDPAGSLLIDAVELERVVKTTTANMSLHNASQLATALASYQGEFLDGFYVEDATRFTEWLLVERERLRYLALDGYQQLTAYYLASGDYETGIQVATALLRLDPTDETGHAHLIRLLAYSGQRAAALAQFDAYRRMLQAEFGVEPDAALQALYRQIRDDTLTAPRPPPSLAPAPRHNLPAQATSFVGRRAELADLTQKLRQPECRLLTLIGLGGSGKTRLAIEAAHQVVDAFPDGVYFVALAALEDATQIPQRMMAALGLTNAGDSDPLARLLDYLTTRTLLVVLDNLEHLPGSANLIITLLQAAPALTLLCTSRIRLNLQAEWQIDITGLTTPAMPGVATDILTAEAVATLAQTEAVQLFTERAQHAWRVFRVDGENLAAILRICHLVGGMPLALELAAGWVRLLSCEQIADELAQNLATLTTTAHDVPDRQRSIQSVLEVTWQQLDAHAQAVLSTLALFQGGFHYRAAVAVAGATLPVLTNLLDHSLIYRFAPERYTMHEFLRHFAYQKLTTVPDLWHKAATDHAHFFVTFLAGYRDLLIGDVTGKAAALEGEWENIRVAWRWLVQTLADPAALDALATMVEVLYRFFDLRSRYREGVAWFGELLAQLTQPAVPQSRTALLLRGKVLGRLARFHYYLSQVAQTEQLAQQALAIATEHGETGEAAFCWMRLGYVANYAGDYATAIQHLTQAHTLYDACNDDEGMGWALNGLGVMQQNSGRMAQARPYYQAAYQQAQRLDHALLLETTLHNLGKTYYELGEYDQALTYLQAGLELNQRLAAQEGTAYALLSMAPALANQGKLVEAHEYSEQARVIFREIGHQRGIVFALVQLTAAAQLLNQLDAADRYITEAEQIVQRVPLTQLALMVTTTLARLRFAQNDWPQAQALAQQVLVVCQSAGIDSAAGYAQLLLGEIALAQQAYTQAQAYFEAAGTLARTLEMPPLLLEAITGQARVCQQQGAYERAATLLHFVVTQRALTAAVRRQAQLALTELAARLSAAAMRQSHHAATALTIESAFALAGMT